MISKYNTELLAKRITSNLREIIGLKLIEVDYYCFEYEIQPSEVANDPFYIGGEVILKFENKTVIVSWDENAGWQDHFSVYLGQKSLFLLTSSLVRWNVSNFQPWRNCINQKLVSAEVYGDSADGDSYTPHIIKLNFGSISIFVGNGYETRFGDGDDLVISTSLTGDNSGGWQKMWAVSHSNHLE